MKRYAIDYKGGELSVSPNENGDWVKFKAVQDTFATLTDAILDAQKAANILREAIAKLDNE